uniref:Putative G patch domain-containing protein 1-like protein n=1 Tax=Pararge aegeria TaxID=116150 RepID=S4NY45_9NEOP
MMRIILQLILITILPSNRGMLNVIPHHLEVYLLILILMKSMLGDDQIKTAILRKLLRITIKLKLMRQKRII